MRHRKNNPWQVIMAYMIMVLCSVFSINLPGENGDKWVSVGSAGSHSKEGTPGLQVVRSDQGNLSIVMRTDGFFSSERKENDRVYTALRLGKYNSDMKPGSPYLPAVRQYIYIPAGKTARLNVNPGPPVTFQNYTLYPVQQPGSGLKNNVERPFYYDEAVYAADRLFPTEMVSLGETESVRGHQIALLHICPFQYNPVRKVLSVYPDMEVEVTFVGENRAVSSRLRSSSFDSFIRGIVLNPGAAGKNEPAAIGGDSEGADFLIITAPEFLAAANALHDHKESLGIATVVKTTNDTGITSTAIKNYIQDAYDNWSPAPSYVLLLGDVVYIPVHYRTADPSSYGDYPIGTDLYYACVDGTDYQPDIFLGRISVDTLSQAQTVVQKIISYESNPPALATFYANAAVIACYKDYYEDGYEDGRNVKTAEEIRDFLSIQGYNVERIYTNEYNWSVPTHFNNDYYGNGEPLPPDLLISNGFAWDGDTGNISSAFYSGVSLMIFQGEGDEWGWQYPMFNKDNISTLDNSGLLPVVLSNSSENGYFDAETDDLYNSFDSFCEILLRKPNGGAVAVVGPSRTCYDGYKDFMNEGFIDSVWPDTLPAVPNPDGATPRLGPMLNHGKIAMDILWGDPRGFRKAEYEMVHLFGDPTMVMWTQQPGSTGTQTIKIQSDPGYGIPITVSQSDINGNRDGTTFFTRTFSTGAVVTFTAPATFYGSSFVKWMVDGTIVENTSIELTMDRYHHAIVYYSDEKTLNVKSYPVNGVPITVTPDDNTGSGNGNTNFSRYYNTGVEVTLTAPAGYNGRNFVRWRVDGVDGVPDENRTIHVAMDAGHTVSAEYAILSSDKKILIIDKNLAGSGQKIKTAVEANGFAAEYASFITPTEISPSLYPAVFIAGGSLTTSECVQFTKYLDSGGNLYIENISYLNGYFYVFLKSRFGIEDAWSSWETTRLTGMSGTFTAGFDFTFPAETFWASELIWAEDVTGSFVIWDYMQYSWTVHTGVARDANTFKTIGVGFNFGDLPQNNRTAVMKKYLDFFIPQSPVVRTIQITSPNGGENLALGAVHTVAWNAANISGPLKISLWKDGLPLGVIADQIDPGREQCKWRVGNYAGGTASPGAGYTIKIEEIKSGVCDLSNAAFTISAEPSLHVTSPNGGENLTSGATHTIAWNSSNVSGTLKITLWKNGTQVGVVADGLNPSPGTYSWTVGNYSGGTASPGAGFKIKIEENGSAVSDMSDGPFTILPIPTITVTCPNGDETLLTGTILPITWNAANVTGALKITLWKDGALVGIIALGIDSSQRQFSWTVGAYEGGVASPGGGYKVKIEENKTGVSDESDLAFIIAEAPALTVTSPNGGENLKLGTTHNITWKSSNISGTLKITLLKNGSLVGVIADNINPGDTSYPWTVGDYVGGKAYEGTDYKVKIEENGSSAVDSSDKSFTLSGIAITVVSPNGDENLTIGKTHLITWTASGVKGSLKISLWKNDAQVGVIAGKVDQSRNSFSWTVGNYAGGTATAGAGYEVKIEDDGTSFSDMSDNPFTLSDPPSITVTSPNGSENLITGTTHLITWNSVNISGTMTITLWNGNSQVQVIADNINPAVTSYLWTVDDYPGVNFKVKIEENGAAISDISDESFTISYPHAITSISIYSSPMGNNFFLEKTYEIYWGSTNINRPLKITLWKDGALVGTIVDYLDPEIYSYSWKMGVYIGGAAGPGTGYKVKVEEHDTGVSAIMSTPFTILPIPTIRVTSPVGGEVLTKGTTFNITWKASNVPWTLNITLYKNNDYEGTIASDIDPGVTSYQWTVGNTDYGSAPEGSGYQVEVSLDRTNFSGRSSPYFAIYYPPSLTITSPNGGEKWGLNDVKNISWGVIKVSGTLKFTLWKDNLLVGVIADGVNPTDDTYAWPVGSYIGGKVSPGTGYQIKIEENGSALSDMSDVPFEITPAHTIRVIYPNGGENFQVGTTHTITWTSTNVTHYLNIYLWRDGSEWTFIDSVDAETTSYQWFVDGEVGEGYKIKIEESQTAYSDMSDNWFTISGPYSLRVTSPNGGEQWAKNTVKQITWTSTGLYGPVSIYITREGDYDKHITDVADVTTGYYNWTVGSIYNGGSTVPAGTGYKIKIETNQAPYIYDKSNEPFTITDN